MPGVTCDCCGMAVDKMEVDRDRTCMEPAFKLRAKGSNRSRVLLRIAFIGALTTFVIHGLTWAYATDRLRTGYLAGLQELRQQGWRVTSEQPRRAGWPMAAALQLGPLELDGTPAGVPVAWSATDAELRLDAWRPATLRIVPAGLQRIRLGQAPEVTLTAAAMEVQADGETLQATGQDLVLALPGGDVRVGSMEARTTGSTLQAALTAVRLPDPGLPPVERTVLDADLTQPVPAAADLVQQAVQWRNRGGAVEVRAFTVKAGELAVEASGVARLDAGLQPALDGTAILRGYRPALAALVQAGAVTASAALAANAVLGLLSGRGGQAGATVPVRLADGVLSLAGFPVVRLPAVAWGGTGPLTR